MDYVASMEPPSSSAGALKSTSSHNPRLRGQVTLFMSSNGETSQRPPPLWAARHQTMHQNIKSIHPHCIPVFWDERWGKCKCPPRPAPQIYIFSSPMASGDAPSTSKQWKSEKVAWLLFGDLTRLWNERVKTAYCSLWDCNSGITIAYPLHTYGRYKCSEPCYP